ncbi:Hypothetical protein ABZS17I87_03331 [Kosakonia cowanii]
MQRGRAFFAGFVTLKGFTPITPLFYRELAAFYSERRFAQDEKWQGKEVRVVYAF